MEPNSRLSRVWKVLGLSTYTLNTFRGLEGTSPTPNPHFTYTRSISGKVTVEDDFLELLAGRMAAASPAGRRVLVEQAGALFPARLRQGWRDQLLRRLARVSGDDAGSIRELGRRVDAAIALRSGANIRSTGSAGMDSLVDRILLCGKVLTDRHIRSIIADVPVGKDPSRVFPN